MKSVQRAASELAPHLRVQAVPDVENLVLRPSALLMFGNLWMAGPWVILAYMVGDPFLMQHHPSPALPLYLE